MALRHNKLPQSVRVEDHVWQRVGLERGGRGKTSGEFVVAIIFLRVTDSE